MLLHSGALMTHQRTDMQPEAGLREENISTQLSAAWMAKDQRPPLAALSLCLLLAVGRQQRGGEGGYPTWGSSGQAAEGW